MKKPSFFVSIFLFFLISSHAQKQSVSVDTIYIQILVDSCQNLKGDGDYNSALTVGQNTLAVIELSLPNSNNRTQKFFKISKATTLRNMGNAYRELSDFENALEYYKKCLLIANEVDDKINMGGALLNTGIVYQQLNEYEKSMDYLQQSLEIFEKIGSKKGLAFCFQALGTSYQGISDDSLALQFFEESLNLFDEIHDKRNAATQSNNIAAIFEKQGKYSEALDNYQFSLKMLEEEGDSAGMAYSLAGIGNIYGNGEKNPKKAEPYYMRALALAKKSNDLDMQTQSFGALKDVYKEQGRYKEAFEMYDQFFFAKDSLLKKQNAEGIQRKEMQNDFENKQAKLRAEKEKQAAIDAEKNKRQKTIISFVVGGLLLVIVFSVFIFNRWFVTQKQKKIIEEQKTEVEKSKHEIEEKNKDITDSINYAQRIQRAMLPHRKEILAVFPESFVLFKPKDIVSGDFYWANTGKELFYIGCCDCTGHGVPGAFMSLLNISFLNQAVNEKAITEPDKILNEARQSIVKALNPDGKEERKDGMDAVLCAIDLKNNVLHAACANNPIWYIQSGELKEIAPDKMPVGSHTNMETSFTKHIIQLQKGDSIYLFTDGYADQFGGPKNKKFRYKQLEETLLASVHLPMKEQKEILDKAFQDWKGSYEQVDDVLVIGMRV